MIPWRSRPHREAFVAHGRQDVLTATVGKLEHLGCAHVARAGVMIKHYFGSASRGSRTFSSMATEDLE